MKWFANLTSGIMLFSLASFAVANEVSIGTASGIPGDQVEIPVTIDTNNGGIASIDIDIGFDNSVLSFVSCAAGSALDTSKQAVTCSTPNATTVRLLINTSPAFGNPPVTAMTTGEMAVVTLAIQSGASAPATSNLVASNTDAADINGTTISGVTFNDGSVTVQAAPAPAITVSPTSQAFTAPQGSTDSRTFTVTNSGNASGLTVSNAAISGTDASNFAVTSNNCPTTTGLSVSRTCSIVVEFTPDAISTFGPASLDITSSAGTENITLTGDGTAGPAGALTIEPSSLDFGDVLTNSETATESFTVTNTGAVGSSVDINPITISAPFSIAITGNTCVGADLAKDESCTVSVTFTPTSDGSASDTLSVSGVDGNGDTKTGTSALSGEGVTEPRPTSNPAPGSTQSEVVGPEGSNDFTVVFGNDGNDEYSVSCSLSSGDTNIWSIGGSGVLSVGNLPANGSSTVVPDGSYTVTTSCDIPDTETYTATLSCDVGQETFTYNYECVGLPPLPIPVDNKWALALLALMMLMAASFGFRFIARQ